MSATQDLIAAALRLTALAERNTDDRDEWQHSISEVREMCARAMVAQQRAAFDEIATIRAQLAAAEARAERLAVALREVEPYIDAIICYASTQGEHHPNKIAADIRATLAEGESG